MGGWGGGQVCFATDSGKCTDAFSVSGDIANILTSTYNGSENVVVITRSFMLVQYSIPTNYPNSSLQQTLKVRQSNRRTPPLRPQPSALAPRCLSPLRSRLSPPSPCRCPACRSR